MYLYKTGLAVAVVVAVVVDIVLQAFFFLFFFYFLLDSKHRLTKILLLKDNIEETSETRGAAQMGFPSLVDTVLA